LFEEPARRNRTGTETVEHSTSLRSRRQNVAPGEAQPSLGKTVKQINKACEAGDRRSSPGMCFVEINTMRAQQSPKLLLERLFSMMLFLIATVFSYALHL
jgi:hypothetical protein